MAGVSSHRPAAIQMPFDNASRVKERHHGDRAGGRESASGAGLHWDEEGLDGLCMLVQQTLKLDPFSGHLFAFRGKKASMLKILFWDGNGLCSQNGSTRAASCGR
ncbi:IS66 family insertion sequence element accessory protein TnpB [Mesorhizobium sp. B2-4-13]|uniref:IS66 family insertion sequence element accessory protein TnpB n=1 Tax=Mesorhizobium sp. B2-4-13 TaxID=2589936 RepID=UPI0032B248C5